MSYTLQRDDSPLYPNADTVYMGSNTFYVETDLAYGEYWYRVRSGNYCCDSDWTEGSNPITVSPPCECDLNHDGTCDMQDWLLFGEDCGRTDCPVE